MIHLEICVSNHSSGLQICSVLIYRHHCDQRDVHGSVHHNTNLIEMTNKMQLWRTIYYSIVPWMVNMFRAILLLIIS